MKRDCAILLGAGVSIDAGIPSSFALTRTVYDKLHEMGRKDQVTLFGYVLAKLIARRVLAGGTPYDPVNIEDAFEALLRLLQRDQDILSEFVYSWDPILDALKPQFDENAFVRAIVQSFSDQSRAMNRGVLAVDQHRLREAAHTISIALGSHNGQRATDDIARMYIDILISILSDPENDASYLDQLARFAISRTQLVATLNYDLLFEQAIRRSTATFDYGLGAWNDKQVVSFSGDCVNLFKLHGSINWSGSPDSFTVTDSAPDISRWRRSNAVMIFGGQSSKLTPHGPFLQLRQSFESGLMRCNRLLIAGYSFGDGHMNALIKRWVATRKKAKLVILDPALVDFGLDVFARSYISDEKNIERTVEIVHVKKTAALGLKDSLDEIVSRVNVKFDRSRSGFLPHILVKRIE